MITIIIDPSKWSLYTTCIKWSILPESLNCVFEEAEPFFSRKKTEGAKKNGPERFDTLPGGPGKGPSFYHRCIMYIHIICRAILFVIVGYTATEPFGR